MSSPELEPLERPPGKEGDDSVNTPEGAEKVSEADLKDAPDLQDADDDE